MPDEESDRELDRMMRKTRRELLRLEAKARRNGSDVCVVRIEAENALKYATDVLNRIERNRT